MREHHSGSTTSVDAMEQRLLAWAAWRKGDILGAGYPTKSVLHESWMPPAPGQLPSMRTAPASSGSALHRQLDDDIRALSIRLQNTLVVVYLHRASVAEQLVLLECQASTVRARVGEAKRLLGRMAEGRQVLDCPTPSAKGERTNGKGF